MEGIEAQAKALKVLVELAEDKTQAAGIRIEAAKMIVNRPRHFFIPEDQIEEH